MRNCCSGCLGSSSNSRNNDPVVSSPPPPVQNVPSSPFIVQVMGNCCRGCLRSSSNMGNCCRGCLRSSSNMGNCCRGCLQSSSKSDNGPVVSSLPPLTQNGPSSPPPFQSIIKNLKRYIEEVDPTDQIDPLIHFIEYQLKKMKEEEEASPSSTGQAESVASSIRLADEFVKIISTEAENNLNLEMAQEMGSVALNAVKAISQSHWVFLGLSVVAYGVDRYVKMKSNVEECMALLERFVELAKLVKEMKQTIPECGEKLCKAVQVIVEGAVVCLGYMAKGGVHRRIAICRLQSSQQDSSIP